MPPQGGIFFTNGEKKAGKDSKIGISHLLESKKLRHTDVD